MGTGKNAPTDIEKEIIKYKKRILKIKIVEYISTGLLLFAIFASLIVVVVLQFSSDNTSYKEAAQIYSTYTGIVLGFVAMTVSLIGMILSFHNTKQSEESNLETTIEFVNLKHSVSEIKTIEESLSRTLDALEKKTVDMDKFKAIEKRLEELTIELRANYDRNKGSATDKATTTSVKREPGSETMDTDEDQETDTHEHKNAPESK